MRFERIILPAAALALALNSGCSRKPIAVTEVVAAASPSLPLDPQDRQWVAAPEYTGALLLQDLVEPRLMTPSTTQLKVRALTDGVRIAFRLEWQDPSPDDAPGPGRSIDGCAVQLPQETSPVPPAPQMGEAGRPVQVTFWRADWQAAVDGRGDSIRDLYPQASVDHYPFQAPTLGAGSEAQKEMARRYAPAEAVGNLRTGPRKVPVEDLVAEGPGTLTPAPQQASDGKGIRSKAGWLVVLRRLLPEGVGPGQRTQVAFAVWEGSHGEIGARKMRTGWVPLLRQGTRP